MARDRPPFHPDRVVSMPRFHYRSSVPHPPRLVYQWHTRPGAFERLQPPWLDVELVGRTGGLEEGSEVELRVGRGPLRARWGLRHVDVKAGRSFRDVQRSGPFRRWVHTHRFTPDGEGGCLVEDEIEWEPPRLPGARALGGPLVRRELERAFRFRHERLANDLGRVGGEEDAGDGRRVAVSGASGLLGGSLAAFLRAGGWEVVPLVRHRKAASDGAIYWNVEEGVVEADALEGIDGVVHLAGEPLFGLGWSQEKKEAILRSRKEGTALLSRTLAELRKPPKTLVSASAVGYYGDGGEAVLTEEDLPGDGFLARVCQAWEGATAPAQEGGIRVVRLRFGIVLTPGGGALRLMLPAFRAGLGGPIGSGNQYMAWIALDDALGLIHRALVSEGLEGPVNATAPHPVTNATFTDALGRVLGRPTFLRVPAPAVRLLLGEMGRETLLSGQRAVPTRAEADGFPFLYPGLEDALRFQLGRAPVPAPAG